MAQVVRSDTVVNPGTVALDMVSRGVDKTFMVGIGERARGNLLVVLRNATAATTTMLAAKRLSRHARDAKVFFVKFP